MLACCEKNRYFAVNKYFKRGIEMKSLKGKTIYIGRDPQANTLGLAVKINGSLQKSTIGSPNSVPTTVSRLIAEQGVAHCRIDVDNEGNMLLTNMKLQNITSVDGQPVQAKRITPSSNISLGPAHHKLPLHKVMEAASKMVGVKEVDISHLERIWDAYHEETFKIKKRQKQLGLMRGLIPVFTIGGGVLAAVFSKGEKHGTEISVAATVFALVVLVVINFVAFKDKSLEETEQLNDYFQDAYVCPNCGNFMGNQPWKIIAKRTKCPHCGIKFIK